MKKKAMAAALTALMTMTSAAGMASAADNELDVFVDQTQIGVKAFEENGKKRIARLPSLLPQVKILDKNIKYLDLRWEQVNYIKLDD